MSKSVYLQNFNSVGSLKVCVFLVIVQVLWQGFQIDSDLCHSHWTGENVVTYNEVEIERNMTIYAILCAGTALMALARVVTISFLCLHASRSLFDSMARSRQSASLRSFNTNRIDRILNR